MNVALEEVMDNVVMMTSQIVVRAMYRKRHFVVRVVYVVKLRMIRVAMTVRGIHVVYLSEVLLLREVLSRVVLEVVVIIQNSVMHQRG